MNTQIPTIKIIDNSGVRMAFEFDTRNYKSSIDFSELVTNIREIFKEEYRKISNFFITEYPELISISLEQEKITSVSRALACLDSEMSSKIELRFRIYYSSLLELLDYFSSGNQESIVEFRKTIVHELIHATDLSVLHKTNEEQNCSYRLRKNEYKFITKVGEKDGYSYNVKWAFLGFISTFRNEGVAILGQKLLVKDNTKTSQRAEAFKHFKEDFKLVLQLCEGLDYSSKLSDTSIYSILDKIKINAYNYAETLVLEILKEKNLISDDTIYMVYDYIENPDKEIEITEGITFKILTACFNLDLSEYINGLLLLKCKSGERYLLDHGEFYKYCGYLQKDQNEEIISTFSNNILKAVCNKDKSEFIKTLKEVLGYPMAPEEIRLLYKEFEQNEKSENIITEIKDLGRFLLEQIEGEHSDISIWSLTYLLDDNDLIYDSISLLGWQDDWIVMDAAVKIIKSLRN